jgi:putative Mg2+ transporter-C (MgtC) family protein
MEPVTAVASLRELLVRLGLALLIGAVLGVNRDLRGKPAGLKTHALVALGSCMLTVVALAVSSGGPADGNAASRVIQGIITGIGFLGAGVILRGERGYSVQGLTTAASVWLAACLGIACGAGQRSVALVTFGATLLVLLVGEPIERAVYRMWHGREAGTSGS